MATWFTLIALHGLAALTLQQPGDWRSTTFEVPDDEPLQLHDMDGDGDLDLVHITPQAMTIHLLDEGRFVEAHELAWPNGDVDWQLADLDGDGQVELLMLHGAKRLDARVLMDAGGFGEARVLVDDTQAAVPRGVRQVPFARDVDGDGRSDIVIPGRGAYRIYLSAADGTLGTPLDVEFQAEIRARTGDPDRVDGRFSRTVRIPWFQIRDVDGDGRNDLVSRSDDRAQFHIADPELSQEPTWTLDLRPEQRRGRDIDFEDLFGNLEKRLNWGVADIDGVTPNDVVLHRDGTFLLYLGGSRGDIERDPDQVLKASGNVLHFLLRDVLGDERPDLQIIRAERVSLGRALRWLIIPGALDFDVYTYENQGDSFSLKPSQRSKVRLEIPGLISFMSDLEDTQHDIDDRLEIPASRIDLDGDGVPDDIVDFEEGKLLFFEGAVPEDHREAMSDKLGTGELDELLETFILSDLDDMEDGAVRSIDIGDLQNIDITPGHALRTARAGRTADGSAPVALATVHRIQVMDLDGDGRDDVVVAGVDDDGDRQVILLVARP